MKSYQSPEEVNQKKMRKVGNLLFLVSVLSIIGAIFATGALTIIGIIVAGLTAVFGFLLHIMSWINVQ